MCDVGRPLFSQCTKYIDDETKCIFSLCTHYHQHHWASTARLYVFCEICNYYIWEVWFLEWDVGTLGRQILYVEKTVEFRMDAELDFGSDGDRPARKVLV